MAANTLLGDVLRRNSGFSGNQVQSATFPSGLMPAWAYQGFLIKIKSIDRCAIESKRQPEIRIFENALLGSIQ